MSIFCHLVAHPQDSGPADFELLNGFVASLQPEQRISEGIERFYNLCSIFVMVAQAYLQAKQQHRGTTAEGATDGTPAPTQQTSISNLSQRHSSFTPLALSTGNEVTAASHVNINYFSDANQVEDDQQYIDLMDPQAWYSGDASLYGLLEHDLSDINKAVFGFLGKRKRRQVKDG
jgi:hypothetical protein